jgi:serine/threonine protein kinase/WD40 repeat protein
MVRRTNETEAEPVDRDERLGEAIEAYLALSEAGQAPDPATFAAGYPDLEEDLVAALGGLALVQGLVGDPTGPGHRLESGRRVAGYRIVRELGRGGMGIVYEAVHVGLDRPVALKVLGSSAAPDSTGRRRFLNEARTAAGLHHTHIVPVFDVGQVGGLCYYAMQRIEGSGLDRVIKHLRRDRTVAAGSSASGRRAPMVTAHDLDQTGLLGDSTATWAGRGSHRPLRDLDDDEPTPFEPPRGSAYYRWVAAVGRQAAEALAHAHQRGVIHRDVKPSNILVDARGIVWMADFGLARRLADPSQTQVDSLLGTPRYMSPEQARIGPIDGRSDVYSLGATLYEMLTLRPPFEGRTAAELIEQIAGRDPVAPRQFDPKVPRDLETIVIKALQKRAVDRYASATELADDLERYLNHEPVRARRIGPIGRAWRVARRHPSLTIVSAVATATVIGSSTLAYIRVLHERDDARTARSDAQDAALKLEVAIRDAQSALRSQLIQNAEVVRMSSTADRRSTGLDLLKRAADLPAGPAERMQLRDEAVAYLAIRDVEKRPDVPLPDQPHGIAFAPDGQHVATLSEDLTTVQFWNVATRTVIETQDLGSGLPRPDGPNRGRGGRRNGGNPFSRPGSRIVAAGDDIAVIQPDGKGIRLFHAVTGAFSADLRLFGNRPLDIGPPEADREIVVIAASTDGRRLVTVDRPIDSRLMDMRAPRADYRVHLWNIASPDRPLASLYEPRADPKADPFARNVPPLVAISPDGATVAVAPFFEAEISIWARDGKERDTIDSQAQLTAMALGSEGLLAAAGNRAVHLWDLDNLDTTRASLPSLTPNLGFVDQLRFSPDDGTLLAVAGRGSGVELWDVAATSKVATLPLPGEWHGLAIAPKSRLLALGQPASLALWAVVDPQALAQVGGFPTSIRSVAFGPDGTLAMTDRDGMLRLLERGHCPTTADVVESVRPSSIAFDAAGRLIALSLPRNDIPGRLAAPDRVDWLSLPGFKSQASLRLPNPSRGSGNPWMGGFKFSTPRIARTPNDRTVVITRGNEVFVSKVKDDGLPGPLARVEFPSTHDSGRPNRSSEGRPDRQAPPPRLNGWREVAISPDGNQLYLLSFESERLSVWSLRGSQAEPLSWTVPGSFTSMALSADGSRLAIGNRDGVVLVLDPSNGRLVHHLTPRDGDGAVAVHAIAFSPDRTEIAVGTVDQVRVWSILEGAARPFVRLPGHHGPVLTLAYDPTGRVMASGGHDKTVKVWNLERVRAELANLGLDESSLAPTN